MLPGFRSRFQQFYVLAGSLALALGATACVNTESLNTAIEAGAKEAGGGSVNPQPTATVTPTGTPTANPGGGGGDTTPPLVTITLPEAGKAAASGLTISGNCEPGLTVTIGGSGVQPATATCGGGSYSAAVTFTAGEGEKSVTVTQTDAAGNTGSALRSFTRDSLPPNTAITSPDAMTAAKASLTVSGDCENGLSISLSGVGVSLPASIACTNGRFSVDVTLLGEDGTKSVSVSQQDAAGNSKNESRSFIKRSTGPAVSILSPPAGTAAKSGLTLSGACVNGLPVVLGGSGLASPNSATCSNGSYAVDIVFAGGDGDKNIVVSQTDGLGNTGSASITYKKDNAIPQVTIDSPAAGAATKTATVTLSGGCSANLTVNITGDIKNLPKTLTCPSGTYATTVTLTDGDGLKAVTLTQTSATQLSGSTTREIRLDTQAPGLSVDQANNTFGQFTGVAGQYNVRLTGGCETDLPVNFGGTGLDLTRVKTTGCADSKYDASITLASGAGTARQITISQEDAARNSTTIARTFLRDSTAPTLSISSPIPGDEVPRNFSITGACEAPYKVNVSGDIAAPAEGDCTGGTTKRYTIALEVASGGNSTKTISVAQTDAALNSATRTVQVFYDSEPPTVTISAPAAGATVLSNVVVSGSCETASPATPVLISGPVTGSPVSASCTGSTYLATVTLTAPDEAKVITVSQADANSNTTTLTRTVTLLATPVVTDLTPPAIEEDTASAAITLPYTIGGNAQATACAVSSLSNLVIAQACSCSSGVCTVKVRGTTDYNGPASFDYTVTAAGKTSSAARASLTINAVNDAPSISAISNATVMTGTSKTVTFSLTDPDHALSCSGSNLSFSSGATTIVPSSGVTWGGTAPDCSATISPVAGKTGAAPLTITASDGISQSTRTFTLTFSDPVDQTWTFLTGSEASYNYPAGSIDFTGGFARLKPSDQIDDDYTASGFAGGTASGVVWDSTSSFLKLDSSGTAALNAGMQTSLAPQATSLVALWRMNETTTDTAPGAKDFADSSGNGNHGAIHMAGVTMGVAGRIGKAATFNAAGSCVNAGSLAPGLTNALTVSAWINSTNISGSGQTVISKTTGTAAGTTFELKFDSNTGRPQAVIGVGGSTGSVTSPNSLSSNTWYHLAMTYDGSLLKLYVNGVQVNAGGISGALNASAEPVDIGCRALVTTNFAGSAFAGTIDEVAIWRAALSSSEILGLFESSAAQYAGVFTSRVMDGGASTQSWSSLRWTSTLPFGKELPPAQNETSAVYPSLATDTLATGLVGLWHLNETFTGSAPGGRDFKDYSGNSNGATRGGAGATLGANGRFGKAVQFNGTATAYLSIPSTASLQTLSNNLTVSAWVKLPGSGGGGMIFSSGSRIVLGGQGAYLEATPTSASFTVVHTSGYGYTASKAQSLQPGSWHHLVGVRAGTSITLYLNGQATTVPCDPGALRQSGPSLIGSNHDGTAYTSMFQGSIDEVAAWNRPLSALEIQQLYQRGAANLGFQVRVCANADCSDGAWQGPNGTATTFFSELNNNSQQASGTGDVLVTAPVLGFANFGTMVLPTRRYFQYRTFLESTDSTITLGPQLKTVSIGPDHYDPGAPAISNKTGAALNPVFAFRQTQGSCTGGVKYIFSNDGTSWLYHNGSAWVASNGTPTQANTPAQLTNSVISALTGGSMYFKAFLQSSGTAGCQLQDVTLTGMP